MCFLSNLVRRDFFENLLFDFKETTFDLSKYKTKTTTATKIQEINTVSIFYCLQDIYSKNFQTYANIAASAQKVIEYNLSKIFKHAYDITNLKNYLFTGGVAMNSVAINKLIKNCLVKYLKIIQGV